MFLATIALAKRLAHLLTGYLGGDVRVDLKQRSFKQNSRRGLTAGFMSIAVYAAITQLGISQISVVEPAQTPAFELAQTSESEPEVIVRALLDAMQANDAERIRSLFDANASQAYGDEPAKSGEEFFRWLDSDIIQREGRVENAQLAVDGSEVVVSQYQSRGYTSEANFLLTVKNGRIASWRMRY